MNVIECADRVAVPGDAASGSAAALRGIGFVAQDAPLCKDLFVHDMLHLTRNLNGHRDERRSTARLDDLRMPRQKKVGQLPGGQQAQLALVALCTWAGLFFLTIGVLRPHYVAPYVGRANAITVKWWIVGHSHAGAWVLYQPESRFWLLQFIEGGWPLVLAVLLLGGSVWYVRRRVT